MQVHFLTLILISLPVFLSSCSAKSENIADNADHKKYGIPDSFETPDHLKGYLRLDLDKEEKDEATKKLPAQTRQSVSDFLYTQGLLKYSEGELDLAKILFELSLHYNPDNRRPRKALERLEEDLLKN